MGTQFNAVVNFTKCTATSITASNRIAKWLANRTEGVLIDDLKIARQLIESRSMIDVLFIVNGMFGFCDFRDEIIELTKRSKKIVWIGNDYAIRIPSQLKFIKTSAALIAQYANFEGLPVYFPLDLNKLTYNHCTPLSLPSVKYEGLLYYGAYRKQRASMFDKYLCQTGLYTVMVSTSSRNIGAFKQHNPNIRFMYNMPNLLNTIGAFQATVYIHDDMPDDILLTPANRFYECLSAGLLMLFDRNTISTFDHAGININPWVVDSPADVAAALADHDELLKQQQDALRKRNYRAELDDEFSTIFSKLLNQ